MEKIILKRFETSAQGTFGKIYFGSDQLFTGELPWHDNEANTSCIGEGTYACHWTYSQHFGRFLYAIANVAGRSGVRIHSANFMGDCPPWLKQLNGCVALGEKLGTMNGQKAVLLSAPAVRKFQNYLKQKTFLLEVGRVAS